MVRMLWMTARKGYPNLSAEAQEQIALDALLRSVECELRIQCIMQECKTLDKAVDIMEKFEAVRGIEPKTSGATSENFSPPASQ